MPPSPFYVHHASYDYSPLHAAPHPGAASQHRHGSALPIARRAWHLPQPTHLQMRWRRLLHGPLPRPCQHPVLRSSPLGAVHSAAGASRSERYVASPLQVPYPLSPCLSYGAFFFLYLLHYVHTVNFFFLSTRHASSLTYHDPLPILMSSYLRKQLLISVMLW